ncbi:MAG: methylated-DNA--[protein]-cysteine S-methyltransferase [Actinomycetota bacterium]|nr:methylated-DNA--[protein]-cysteine S-methyltransferase [Actinomycetota bacterium]
MDESGLKALIYQSKWGFGAIIFKGVNVKRHILPTLSEDEIALNLADGYKILGLESRSSRIPDEVLVLRADLIDYFLGQRVEFNLSLDLEGFGRFEEEVLLSACQIPYGEMMTYKELAGISGRPKAFRAVGNALAKNQLLAIIPCHRVVATGGGLGGFSGPAGIKEKLLELENVHLDVRP